MTTANITFDYTVAPPNVALRGKCSYSSKKGGRRKSNDIDSLFLALAQNSFPSFAKPVINISVTNREPLKTRGRHTDSSLTHSYSCLHTIEKYQRYNQSNESNEHNSARVTPGQISLEARTGIEAAMLGILSWKEDSLEPGGTQFWVNLCKTAAKTMSHLQAIDFNEI